MTMAYADGLLNAIYEWNCVIYEISIIRLILPSLYRVFITNIRFTDKYINDLC